jgi:hypothetical protein
MENQVQKIVLYSFITMILVALIFVYALFSFYRTPATSFSGVQIGNEYTATHLVATTTLAAQIRQGRGTFGGYVINVLGTGSVIFYDATSTLPAQRTIQATTSLPVVGYISASQAAGVYTYDTRFLQGLIAVFSGTQGTSTVLTR